MTGCTFDRVGDRIGEKGSGRPFIEFADCSRTPRTAIKNLVLGFRKVRLQFDILIRGFPYPRCNPQGGGGGRACELVPELASVSITDRKP